MISISVGLPLCPNCGSEWIAHKEDDSNSICETCGQKLRTKDGFNYEMV